MGYAHNSWIIPATADVMMTYRREIEPDGSATEALLASEATKADRLLSEAGSGPVLLFLQKFMQCLNPDWWGFSINFAGPFPSSSQSASI